MKSTNFLHFKYLTFVFLGLGLFHSCQDHALESAVHTTCNKDAIEAVQLISIADAVKKIDKENPLILEVSKRKEYERGHLPGALHVWRPDFRTKDTSALSGMRCTTAELENFLQNLGAQNNQQLLLYDAKGGSDAMRLAWVFDYYGFANYAVINGGKQAWKISGHALQSEDNVPSPNPDFSFKGKEHPSILATFDEVKAAIRNPQTVLVDTREDYEYRGQCFVKDDIVYPYKKGASARGCIPGAVHLNWSTLSDLSSDHRVKCMKDLEYDLTKKGITKDKNIIVYCQSGSRSSHTAFVLSKILNYPNVKNYDGSWIEWSHFAQLDDETPILVQVDKTAFDKEFQRLEQKIKPKAAVSN